MFFIVSECDDGSYKYGNMCLSLHLELKTWTEALEYCLTQGGSLAEFPFEDHTLTQQLIKDFPQLTKRKGMVKYISNLQ